jgi:hypothetical protein
MTLLKATVTGNLSKALDQELVRVAAGMRRAVSTAGRLTQAALRNQARAAGFRDGGKAVANSWRLAVYPPPGRAPRTLKPAALVYSRMPDVVTAFDQGATITAKGGKYLAFPTGYNAVGGRRGAGRRGGLRITPQQMIAAGKRGEAFIIPSKSNPRLRLWCLRVAGAYGVTKRTRNRLRLFVGTATEIGTARGKGAAQRRREILAKGFVPMFFLARQVSLRKRLNVDQVRAQAPGWFAAAAVRELASGR